MDTGHITIIILLCVVVYARWKMNQSNNNDSNKTQDNGKNKN
jgi:hypothetical protein